MPDAAFRPDLYTRITDQIIGAIEAGQTTFELPWHRQSLGLPRNLITGRPYRGINSLLLWLTGRNRGYRSSEWATFKQWHERGFSVRKGEKAATVVFWKSLARQPDLEDEPAGAAAARAPVLARAFSVFNASQIEGYQQTLPEELPESERVAKAEAFFAGLDADVRHGAGHAFYSPSADQIHLPDFAIFLDAGGYYATRAHETVHWTGAKHRLDRDLKGRFGSRAYAMEELIAELGAAFLCAGLGLTAEPRPDHAGYIASWLEVLKQDGRAIFTAASKAQQAVDWLSQGMAPPPPRKPLTRLPTSFSAYPGGRRGGGPKTLYL
jgi:antirestriction protein ArdC